MKRKFKKKKDPLSHFRHENGQNNESSEGKNGRIAMKDKKET